jgi:hypothetical protein
MIFITKKALSTIVIAPVKAGQVSEEINVVKHQMPF